MSGRVVGRIFERIVGSAVEKAVLTCLGEHSDPDGKMSYPSVQRISLETELSESSVRSALSNLRRRKLIVQTHPPAGHRPATYRVNLEGLSDLQLVEVYRPGLQVLEVQEVEVHQAAPDLQVVEGRPPGPGARPPGGGARPPGGGPEPSLTVLTVTEPSRTSATSSSPNPSRDQTLFVQALALLRQRLPKAEFFTWIVDSEVASVVEEDGEVRMQLRAANHYGSEKLREHREAIEAAVSEVAGRPASVSIEAA